VPWQSQDAASLENAKARFLGKQGAITALMKGLAQMEPEQKKSSRCQHQRAQARN